MAKLESTATIKVADFLKDRDHSLAPGDADDFERMQSASAIVDVFEAALASAPSPEPQASNAGAVETYRTIGLWADEAFGAATVLRRLERAGEELDEAKIAEPGKVLEEIADVVICLAAAAHSHGGDLQAAINTKMAINRARKWAVRGDGTGYHIPASDAPARTALSSIEPTPSPEPQAANALAVEVPQSLLGLVDDIRARVIAALKDRRVSSSHVAVSSLNTCVYRIDALKSELAALTAPQPYTGERDTVSYAAGFEAGGRVERERGDALEKLREVERTAREVAERTRDNALDRADESDRLRVEAFMAHEAAERRLAEVGERAREDERDRLVALLNDGNSSWCDHAYTWLTSEEEAMLPADRAALRAKPEAQAIAAKELGE